MSLKNIIMFIEYIIEMVRYYLGLLLNKIGIERKSEIFIKNKNWEILDDYYNENYDVDCELEEEYLGKYYRGYELENGKRLKRKKRKKNMSIEEKRDFNLVDYKFSLPIHEEVLNKLKINIDRSKYKFIYISLITKDYTIYKTDEYYKFLNDFFKEVNFIFIYESFFAEYIDYNIDKSRNSYELLLCVNSENMISVMNALNDIEKFKEYKYIIREVDNEMEFFKGNYLLEQFRNSDVSLSHTNHEFLVYKLDEKLEDYYILGNYINSFYSISVLNYTDSINLDLYVNWHYSEEEIEEINKLNDVDRLEIQNKIENEIKKRKDRIYKNIKNEYLKKTYYCYILLHTSSLDKYKYKVKLFFNKIKKLHILYSVISFKAKSCNDFAVLNQHFHELNYRIIKEEKNYDYGDVKRRYHELFKRNDSKQTIDDIHIDLKHSRKALFEDNGFNWEVIKSINNYKNMLSHMNVCKGKSEESFNKFLIENPTINNTLQYGEDYKLNNFDEVNDSVLFRKYNVEVWDKNKLLDEVDLNVNRLEDVDIQRALKHLVLSIKNEDKIIFYPLTHSKYLRVDVSILKQQILENKNINIDEGILNELIEELRRIKNIEVENVELYRYVHNKKEEIQFRTGKCFECTKKNEVLIPEKRKVLIPEKREVLIPEKQEVLLPDYKTVIRKYNDNYECLTTSHNLRMNIKKVKEDDIYNMCNNNKVEYIFNPENSGLRKFSEIFNYLKEYFLV